ncbi:AAA family ATPase [Bacillus solimangrovi]|uniref:Nuclease SbcCD subunit C n=1 Tax=Bacillus solimangrovi TaxID=1305675 RepID=A0A1E5LC59_9BACI|nr:AAA family ATPase [Bacillus solimangrovi]OEH91675.1 hypothetical protein BFG57_04705 [Bacillus solimangrovi]
MRPIQLSVAGLHSFREKQEVDFEALTSGGVFGIFGPTGSGKSSLLDAMTLALYGKVERAANNTQGIMNHAEDTLDVGLTFELGNAKATKRYRVERRFKRTGDVNLRSSSCRLLDLSEGETVVIAEKAGDVNESIQELLGLTIDDFTRAVVLPQGKFAEFLSLKGSDRRQMLQRLFHLEQYGDRLNQKLRERIQEAEVSIGQIEAEKNGLGDASKEALKLADEHLQEAEKQLIEKKGQLEKIESQFEEAKLVKQLQERKEQIEGVLSELQKQQFEIERLFEKLEKARQADLLSPYLEEFELANAQKEKADSEKTFIEKQYNKAKKLALESEQSYQKIKKQFDVEMPILTQEIEKLRVAVEEKQTLIQIQHEQKKLIEEINNRQNEVLKVQNQMKQAEHLQEKGLMRQKELQEKMNEIEIPVEERQQIQSAVLAKQAIEHQTQHVKELNERFQVRTDQYVQQKNALQSSEQQLQISNESLKQLFERNERIYTVIAERERELEKHATFITNVLHRKKAEFDKEKANQLANELVHQLEQGKPCPVCGSIEHPAPLQFNNSDVSQLIDYIQHVEKLLREFEDMKIHLSSYRLQLEQCSAELTEVLKDKTPVLQIQQEIKPIVNELSEEDIENGFQSFSTEYKALGQDVLELKEAIRKQIRTSREARQAFEEREGRIVHLQKDLKVEEERCTLKQAELERMTKDWIKQFPNLIIDEVSSRYNKLNEIDKLIVDLRMRIEKSVPYLEEKEEEIKHLHQQSVQSEQQLAIAKTSIESKEREANRLLQKVERYAQVDQVESKLTEKKQTMDRLNIDMEQTYQTWQQEKEKYYQIQTKAASATSTYEHASDRVRLAEKRWDEKFSNSSFVTVESLKDCIKSKDEQESWQHTIDSHNEQMKQCKANYSEVKKELQGRTLLDEQWKQVQLHRNTLQEEVSNAQERKGAMFEMLQDVKRKAERYHQLDVKGKGLEKVNERNKKLQQVFRGNAFVEFVAEEQLVHVSKDASDRLKRLTRGRYAIEVDSEGGFIIRDDANGGVKRPVSTLSGGETFLTSLSLALSLSAQIQLRGEYPLEFFFLDEGFGTLDQELLDTVITSLEKLNNQKLSVGVISHVPELKERLPRKLIVTPAEPSGKGSSVHLEAL